MKEKKTLDENEQMKNEMEKMVDTYDDYMKKVTLGREAVLRGVELDLAGVKPGDAVLEVGCGTGTLTLAAKKRTGPSGRVCGIDIIPKMVEYSRNKAKLSGEEIDFQTGGIDKIPFEKNQFDVVVCSFMIFHMSDDVRNRGILEIYRVLKPGGRLMILDMGLPANPVAGLIAKVFFGGMLKHELKELFPVMENAGFAGVEIVPAQFSIMGLSVLFCIRGTAQKK